MMRTAASVHLVFGSHAQFIGLVFGPTLQTPISFYLDAQWITYEAAQQTFEKEG